MPGQPLELCRLPWAIPSQDEPPNGARVGGQATVRGGRPLLLLLLPLGTLSAKNKLSENHISFWVKGEKCNISSKWEALRLPAPGISPRSFLPLGEARGAGKGGGERWRKAEEGSRKERPVTADLGQLGVWKPVGLFVLEQLKTRKGLIRKRKASKKAAVSRKPVRAVTAAPARILGAVQGQRQSGRLARGRSWRWVQRKYTRSLKSSLVEKTILLACTLLPLSLLRTCGRFWGVFSDSD